MEWGFYILLLCKNYIISNSTYSFWAAYFGEVHEGIICSPKEWITIGAIPSPLPNRWIQIKDSINPYIINNDEKNKIKAEIYFLQNKINK